jgi:hypothetical protein
MRDATLATFLAFANNQTLAFVANDSVRSCIAQRFGIR